MKPRHAVALVLVGWYLKVPFYLAFAAYFGVATVWRLERW
jgi:hypothetical protein